MKLVYIAGPYRAADREGVERNIANARAVAIELLKALHYKPVVQVIGGHGYDDSPENRSLIEKLDQNAPFPVIPHMNTALLDFETALTGVHDEFWLQGTMRQLVDCDYVILVRPDAAEHSVGTRNEVYEANREGIPVFENVYAFLHYLKDDKFRAQVDHMAKRIMLDPYGNRVGRTLHIFGSPIYDQPQSQKQVP